MFGARSAIADGFDHIEAQVHALETAVTANPANALDLAKTIIESTCKALLEERGVAYEKRDSLPKLFKTVTSHLPLLPAGASGEVRARRSLAMALNGLSASVQGLCELRNEYGFDSHGDGSERAKLDAVQALLAARIADAAIGFLHTCHRLDIARQLGRRLDFGDNPEFNDAVDASYGSIGVYELAFSASDVLFQMDPESYRIYLTEFLESEREDMGTDDESGAGGGE